MIIDPRLFCCPRFTQSCLNPRYLTVHLAVFGMSDDSQNKTVKCPLNVNNALGKTEFKPVALTVAEASVVDHKMR